MQKRNTQLTMKDIDASMVFGILVGVVAAIVALPLLIVWALIMNTTANSRSNIPRNDEKIQAEIDATAYEESGMIHQHYEMNGTIVEGLKDPEW